MKNKNKKEWVNLDKNLTITEVNTEVKGDYTPEFNWDYNKINTVQDFDQLDKTLSAWLKMTDNMKRVVIYTGSMEDAVLRVRNDWEKEDIKILEEEKALKEQFKDENVTPIDVYIGDSETGFHKIDAKTGDVSLEKYDLKDGKYELRS